jgi:transcriptional regulator with XRE-family HTH domain
METTDTRRSGLPALRRLRDRATLTQLELAERSGVSRETVARAEVGLVAPRPSTIRKLAAALRVRPHQLREAGGA